jgi:sterol 3beta-glucosyltransferase
VENEDESADGSEAQRLVDSQIGEEERIGRVEEQLEIFRAASQTDPNNIDLAPAIPYAAPIGQDNTGAALREAGEGDQGTMEAVEERMGLNADEKKRIRKEKLAERLMSVFGLEQHEEVIEEMKCWLLRSVSKLFCLKQVIT